MIKLIASDMDGTLLDSNGNLPEDFFNILNKLVERGVIFVAASGRQYFTLAKNLSKGKDKITFAAENGAFIVHQGKELFSKALSRKTVLDIIEDSNKIHDCKIILCGKNSAYIHDTDPEFIKQVNKYYYKNTIVADFNDITDEIFKVAIYDYQGPEKNSNKIMYPKWGQTLQVTISGEKWLDIGRNDINKGVAIKFLQHKYGIKEEETMVFGDYYNDIHMLKSAYHSYVMLNAPEDIKKYGRFVAESNDDDGVLRVIKSQVLAKEA
jgi:Cof subfamily protein (haloacid dehalogenase superfamily)